MNIIRGHLFLTEFGKLEFIPAQPGWKIYWKPICPCPSVSIRG